MNTIEIVILCSLSALVVILSWKVNTQKNRSPFERAVWAFIFGMPLWTYIVFPILDALSGR